MMNMENLAAIAAGFAAFEAKVEATGGVLTEELAQEFDCLNLSESQNIEEYSLYLRDLEARAAAREGRRAYYQRLADAEAVGKRAIENDIKWHLARVKAYLEDRRLKKIEGERGFGFRLQKNGKPPVEILVPVDQLPREWTRVHVEPDKEAIRQWMEQAGTTFAPNDAGHLCARLGEPTVSVRII